MGVRSAALASVLLLALAACSSSSSGAPATFVAQGHVLLVGGEAVVRMSHDDSCYGVGRNVGFDTGTAVVVSADGVRRAGTLGRSHTVTDGSGTVITGCRFDFRVAAVPSGHATYTVQVGTTRHAVAAATLGKNPTIRVIGVV